MLSKEEEHVTVCLLHSDPLPLGQQHPVLLRGGTTASLLYRS